LTADDHSASAAASYILFGVRNRLSSFAYVLPIVELLFAAIIMLVPALLFFARLRQAAHGTGSVSLTFGEFVMTIPSDRFLHVAFDRAGLLAEKPLTIVNAPAKFVEIVMSLVVARKGNWWPPSLLQSTWHALIYPIYALPAWIYVGVGIDTLIGRHRVNRWNMIFSLLLALTCASLFSGFRFGISAAEREGQERLNWFIDGFVIWAVLFSIPAVAWIHQKKQGTVVKSQLLSS
jgi:hypothetical protein